MNFILRKYKINLFLQKILKVNKNNIKIISLYLVFLVTSFKKRKERK